MRHPRDLSRRRHRCQPRAASTPDRPVQAHDDYPQSIHADHRAVQRHTRCLPRASTTRSIPLPTAHDSAAGTAAIPSATVDSRSSGSSSGGSRRVPSAAAPGGVAGATRRAGRGVVGPTKAADTPKTVRHGVHRGRQPDLDSGSGERGRRRGICCPCQGHPQFPGIQPSRTALLCHAGHRREPSGCASVVAGLRRDATATAIRVRTFGLSLTGEPGRGRSRVARTAIPGGELFEPAVMELAESSGQLPCA